MAALTANVERSAAYPGQGYVATLYATAADTIYKGAILAFAADGSVQVVDGDDNTVKVAGIAMEKFVADGANPEPVLVLCKSRVWFKVDSALAAIATVGDVLIATTDNDVAAADATKLQIGRCVGVNVDANEVLIDMNWATD